jgi:hypothetical protein
VLQADQDPNSIRRKLSATVCVAQLRPAATWAAAALPGWRCGLLPWQQQQHLLLLRHMAVQREHHRCCGLEFHVAVNCGYNHRHSSLTD